jgi:secreted trypsin-like serine protease
MSSWDVARLTVRLGDHNIRISTEVKHVERKVKRIVRHRGFDSRTLYNDIAILTLDQKVPFSKAIKPVCLPAPGSRQYNGLTATVVGWGSLRENGPQPSVLQEVTLPVWTNAECKQKYGPAGEIKFGLTAWQRLTGDCFPQLLEASSSR